MIENNIEKPEKETQTIERKEFMKQVGLSFGAILLLNCLQSCGDSEIPDPNPGGTGDKVDFTLDLNSSTYSKLNNPGGFVVIGDKKIIVARTLDAGDKFVAVDSACTHEGTTLTYRSTERDFYCNQLLSPRNWSSIK